MYTFMIIIEKYESKFIKYLRLNIKTIELNRQSDGKAKDSNPLI